MNKKIRYSNRRGFLDYAEVGKVYDIEVSEEILHRDLLCVPNETGECSGCYLGDMELDCDSGSNRFVCGDGKFIALSDLLEDL